MMDLQQRLTEDMKAAMKSGQKERLGVIRMLLSDVKNIDLMPGKPTAEEVVASYRKKLAKSVDEYEKLNQPERAAALKQEIAIVDEYLPKKADEAETAAMVEAFLQQNAFTAKQVGQAMGAFMKQHGSQVDPAIANRLLRQKLAGQ
jgi:uncharacterized protein YqeY